MTEVNDVTDRPYHSKRPHRKSRAGCRQCKVRKVKCDEGRPSCRACTLRREECVYPPTPTGAESGPAQGQSLPHRRHQKLEPPQQQKKGGQQQQQDDATDVLALSPGASTRSPSPFEPHDTLRVTDEPLFTLGNHDGLDMKLLWFYTTKTYESFCVDDGQPANNRDQVLRITVVQHAFRSPFLMNCILGLAALHMDNLHLDGVARPRALAYRAQTFEGYRKAIEEAKPETYPALLLCSLLLTALASQVFRDPDAQPLYILDWMLCWKGINLIVDLTSHETMIKEGVQRLFFRPPFDLEQAARHIPSNLLFMVSSVPDGDDDFAHVQTYYDALRVLGSLYQELERGFSPTLELRIITFFTFLSTKFIELARERRPRALVVIAHYLVFPQVTNHVWWMKGIGRKDMLEICDLLGDAWEAELRVPRAAADLHSEHEIAKLLLDNHAWEPPDVDFFMPGSDPNLATFRLIDNLGQDYEYALPGNMVFQPVQGSTTDSPPGSGPDMLLTPSNSASSAGAASPASIATPFPHPPSLADNDALAFVEDG